MLVFLNGYRDKQLAEKQASRGEYGVTQLVGVQTSQCRNSDIVPIPDISK